MGSLRLRIVTPHQELLDDNVEMVILPGSEGELGVYPGHIPLVTTLKDGEIQAGKGERERRFRVAGSWAKISSEQVIVLAREAEPLDVRKQ
ncbi:MAG: ATP synthase F1 subunit epsilon [Firmicutes bacterium]|nr:ATP synthase F1 subunit epsilon [Bacillota bacterium]